MTTSLAVTTSNDLKKKEVLKVFSKVGNVSEACEIVGLSRDVFFQTVRRNPDYAEAYHEAEQVYLDSMIKEVDRRAFKGEEEMVVQSGQVVKYKGKPIIRKRYSDNLAMFRIKKVDPAYRDNVDLNILHRIGLDPDSLKETMQMLADNGFNMPNDMLDVGQMVIEGETVG